MLHVFPMQFCSRAEATEKSQRKLCTVNGIDSFDHFLKLPSFLYFEQLMEAKIFTDKLEIIFAHHSMRTLKILPKIDLIIAYLTFN